MSLRAIVGSFLRHNRRLAGRGIEKTCPSLCFAGTGLNISLRCHPAWRVSAPSSLRTSYADLWSRRVVSVSHTRFPFLLALGSPFLSAPLPPFHLRRLSVRKDYGKYLLFFNGLSEHSIPCSLYARLRIVLPLFVPLCLTHSLPCNRIAFA